MKVQKDSEMVAEKGRRPMTASEPPYRLISRRCGKLRVGHA